MILHGSDDHHGGDEQGPKVVAKLHEMKHKKNGADNETGPKHLQAYEAEPRVRQVKDDVAQPCPRSEIGTCHR